MPAIRRTCLQHDVETREVRTEAPAMADGLCPLQGEGGGGAAKHVVVLIKWCSKYTWPDVATKWYRGMPCQATKAHQGNAV
jgi:hypothetical protein